jgi:hypothetical protein
LPDDHRQQFRITFTSYMPEVVLIIDLTVFFALTEK